MKRLLCLCLFCMCLFGCGKDVNENAIVVGLDDTFAPMGFKDDQGEIVGFDVDLAKEVFKRINKEVVFQNIDWDLKESELSKGSIDCIWNGYSITDERKEQVLFSKPYLDNKQIIITLDDSEIKNKKDLKDKVVSVQKNSSAFQAVSKDRAFMESLRNSELVQFDTNNDCFMDLEAKRSDAIVCDETLARYYMKQQNQDIYNVLEEDFGKEQYAIGFRKDDKDLARLVDQAMEEMKKDGTFETIKERWFKD